jgi:hypothetical protein
MMGYLSVSSDSEYSELTCAWNGLHIVKSRSVLARERIISITAVAPLIALFETDPGALDKHSDLERLN